uniref:Uncharacterized protein n=1 Tax=Anguilla anguilla TaxID=7936 RepID=A0A0E9PG68_ANGAN
MHLEYFFSYKMVSQNGTICTVLRFPACKFQISIFNKMSKKHKLFSQNMT